jgi:predicted nucleic acid-binding protein
MIVVDASALLEVLLRTPAAEAVQQRLFLPGQTLHAPHLIDVEVAQVVRRYAAGGEIDGERGRAALFDLADFPLQRYPHDFLLPRIWVLRKNLTAYDAAYVALTEVLDAILLTCDQRLASAPGNRARIELIGSAKVTRK